MAQIPSFPLTFISSCWRFKSGRKDAPPVPGLLRIGGTAGGSETGVEGLLSASLGKRQGLFSNRRGFSGLGNWVDSPASLSPSPPPY